MIGPVTAWPGPARTGRRTRAGGFTLLEVIAAVLLLAITFASLMRVAGSSLALTARSAERSEAAMWGRSLLDSAFVLEPIRVGRSSGRFDERYRWQLDVRPVQPPATAQEGMSGGIVTFDSDHWQLSLSQRLSTGMQLEVDFINDRSKSSAGTAVEPLI